MPARRGPSARRPRRGPNRGGREEAAWREFAASFARAGMVPPAEGGLAAVEAAEGAAVLLLAPQQVSSRRPRRTGSSAACGRRLTALSPRRL